MFHSKNSKVMNTISAKHVPTKNTNNVWAVSIEGQEEMSYCKSPYNAMKLMFLIKSRTGAQISKDSLQQLSAAIAEQKASQLTPEQVAVKEKVEAAVEEFVESHSVDAVLEKPKKVRKPRTRKPKVAEEAA